MKFSLQLKELKDSVVYYHWSDLDTDRLQILPSSIPAPAQLDWVSFILDFPHPPPPHQTSTETWNKAVQNLPNQTTSMEDNLNGRQPKWKMTLMEDDLHGRWP